ncbi:hypothetical protein Baya_15610 [Bagarius yarrelli]|uniref:Uncharacterized protein n=1 Tax=Bagarius yarrelli TaxID=175774 RepID=A0A556VCS4_BAGYA|nr:hypothetical protein Baya_15610 [Bagarius yarrelli]
MLSIPSIPRVTDVTHNHLDVQEQMWSLTFYRHSDTPERCFLDASTRQILQSDDSLSAKICLTHASWNPDDHL